MNLFELFVKIGVDDQASEKLADMSSKLGNGLKTAAKVGLAAVTTAATGIAALATSAIKNFAEYEQLVGGSELMFGKAFDTVKKNAEEAYKTVQMSQNEYLQQVNGFATGLKTALGGNEQAAADLAHRIVQAEADIVAATGNTAENVQNAFNGIMKSNFTMLDNLQIGITPTKEGFQEVIDKVNEWNKANGKATEYQMGNLADMQSALVDYIEMVGMSGYAQKEAAGTIQGSLSMTRSAWSNLITGIADDNANLSVLIDNFVESFSIAAGNIAPRVEIALDGVLKLVNGLMPKIANAVPAAVAKYTPKLVSSGVNILKSLANGIKKNTKMIVTAAKDIVFEAIDGITDLLPDVIDAGVELLSGVVSAVPEVLVKLSKTVPKIARTVANGLVMGIIEVAKAAISLFSPIVDKSEEATNSLKNHLSTLSSFNDLVAEFSRKTVDLSSSLSESGNTISEIEQDIADSEGAITKILKDAFAEQEKLRQEDIENIEAYNQKIREKNEEKLGIYRDQQLAEYRKLMLDIPSADATTLAKYTGQAQSALEASNKVVEEIYDARLVQIENFHKAQETIGSTAYETDLQNAKAYRDEMLAVNQGYYDQTITAAAGASGQLVQTSIDSFAKVGAYTENLRDNFNKWHLTTFLENNKEINSALGFFDESVAKYAKSLDNLDYEAATAFLNMQLSAKEAGVEIDAETANAIDAILSAFTVLPGEFGDVGREGLLTLAEGLEEKIPVLKNAGQMTSEEILDAMRRHLLGNEAEKLTSDFLNKIQEGLNNGTLHVNINTDVVRSVGGGSFRVDGSHESGLDYVPYDGYIAELHKGERVLTASEASGYGAVSFGDVIIQVNGDRHYDENALARAVGVELQNLAYRRVAVFGNG